MHGTGEWDDRHRYEDVTAARKRDIFHDARARCDDPGLRSLIRCCNRCRHLRFEHLLFCVKESLSVDIQIPTRRCTLCKFLAPRPGRIYLEVSDKSKTRPRAAKFYGVNGSSESLHTITTNTSHLYVRPKVDWVWARRWLRYLNRWVDINDHYCQEYHFCSYPYESVPSEMEFDASNETSKAVSVVDVDQKCIIPLRTGQKYVALSYV